MYGQLAGRFCAVSMAALVAAGAGAARAQDSVAIEEVIVTAQKREERALQVPIAITALTGAKLQQLGIRDLAEMSAFTPGLVVQNQSPNNPGYSIRGITSDNTNAFETPRVSVFQDGVSASKAQASFVELFDMDRVEVARGPQSTLYGREALIGAINLIQNKAQVGVLDGSLRAEVGDHRYLIGEGVLNAPLSDSLAVRVAGRLHKRNGYVDNALGGDKFQSVDTWALRTAVKFAPGDRLSADLIVNYQEDHPSGTAFKSLVFAPADPATGVVLDSLAPQTATAIAAPASFNVGDLGVDRTVGGATALLNYKLNEAVTLHSISGWRRYTTREVFDADGTSLPLLTVLAEARGEQFSQELRMNYDDGGRVRGFVGGSFFHTSDKQLVPLQFDERVTLAQLTGQMGANGVPRPLSVLANPALDAQLIRGLIFAQSGNTLLISPAQAAAIAGNLVGNHVEQARVTNALTAADLFADVTFKLTDKFELTGGLRYSHEKSTTGYGTSVYDRSVLGGAIAAGQLAAAGAPASVTTPLLAALGSPFAKTLPATALPLFALLDQPTPNNGDMSRGTNKAHGFAWRTVARYAPTEDTSLYATYARGRRPPVQSAGNPSTPGGPPALGVVASERVDTYEFGAKGAFLQHRLMADVALFHYDYNHFQTIEQRGTRFFATDAGKAKASGLEAQVQLNPVQGLELFATYTHNHARLKSGFWAGNHFRLSPDDSGSFAAVWKIPAFGGDVRIVPTYTWRSKMFFSDNNDRPDLQQPPNALVADNVQDEVQKGFGLANLRVSWTPSNGVATLEVFATNLFDKKYIIDAGNTGDNVGLPTAIAGPPRLVGAAVTYRFR